MLYICLMHSTLTPQNLVALLNIVPLHASANLNSYERRQIGFRTDCSVFRRAKFRSTKSGIKIQTQINIATEIR
jgi:hypothetical protein